MIRVPKRLDGESLPEYDRRLELAGWRPCPRCGERDRLMRMVGATWCDRCIGFLPTLEPLAKRYVPDF